MRDYLVSQEGLEAVEMATGCWNACDDFRRQRARNKDYTFGRQWGDRIFVDGAEMTEFDYIRREGGIPFTNNLIRRVVRSVVGVSRSRVREKLEARDEEGRRHDLDNRMEELYARTMEEFLISGMAVHKKSVAGGEVKTRAVSPGRFFHDPQARDSRGSDLTLLGEVHVMPAASFCATFARDRDDYRRLRAVYGDGGMVRVFELWRRERRERRLCHDRSRGRLLKVDEELWLRRPALRRMPSRWILDDVWRYCFVTSHGEILRQGDSPYGCHPYVVKAYPFLDGEIHSYVGDIIDQQRYTNRLITMYDWVMRASAKGVLLFPEDALPEHTDMQMVMDEWSRFNGVITYRSKPGQPLPQQVSGNNSNLGIGELLAIQLKMMEDVSGVNGALQGKLERGSVSGELYNRQTENSLISLHDILMSYESFIDDAFTLESRLRRVRPNLSDPSPTWSARPPGLRC